MVIVNHEYEKKYHSHIKTIVSGAKINKYKDSHFYIFFFVNAKKKNEKNPFVLQNTVQSINLQ